MMRVLLLLMMRIVGDEMGMLHLRCLRCLGWLRRRRVLILARNCVFSEVKFLEKVGHSP